MALVIGAGSPTGPRRDDAYRRAGRQLAEGERTRQDLPKVVQDVKPGTGIARWKVCANSPDSTAANRKPSARTASTISMTGTGMTITREMRVLPEHEKDRCANTGLSQEASSVIVVGI